MRFLRNSVDVDSVSLEPGDYEGTYKLVGGEISFDLVNTVSWPATTREHDWLDRPCNVTRWAEAAGILSRSNRAILEGRSEAKLREELEQVRQVRSDLQNVLRPLAFSERSSRAAIETLNTLVYEISVLRRIDPTSHRWIWANPESLTEILAPVIWNAAYVLTSADHTRIGHCRSCNWIFHDTSRNRSRRWCDMIDCGSRDKALRYYHRTKSRDAS
ncbi:MAG: CGNR zinc finger domain-containing protein [Chthoniobacterales bacterium]|nr:CGNR zinc finger domain-containing protein [Chthoniobacterales bacterium]